MKNKITLLLVFLTFTYCKAQTVDFYGKKVNTNICNQLGFSNNEEAKNYLDKICDAADLINNYVMMPCPNVGTCLATVSDGVYYILYDNNFLNRVKSLGFTEKKINNTSSSTDWGAITVLSHELGHHALGHFNKLVNVPENYKKNELQADEFAGKTLFKLGATLQQAQIAYNAVPIEGDLTHPKRVDRLKAIQDGYNKEKSRFGNSNNNSSNSTNSAALILGSWSDDKGAVLTFYNNATFKIAQNGKINDGQWSLVDDVLNIKINGAPSDVKVSVVGINTYTLSIKGNDNNISTLKRTNLTATSSETDYLIKNWSKYIYVDKFNFTSRKIGGIWDVNVPFVNNSDYVMDLITVKVDYIKDSNLASGDIYKSELIDFTNIQPHTRQVIKAPDSDRGTGVRTSIIVLHSSVMHIN